MATIYQVGSAVIRDNNNDGFYQEEVDVIQDGKGDRLTYDEFILLRNSECAALLKESREKASLITKPIAEWNRVKADGKKFKINAGVGYEIKPQTPHKWLKEDFSPLLRFNPLYLPKDGGDEDEEVPPGKRPLLFYLETPDILFKNHVCPGLHPSTTIMELDDL